MLILIIINDDTVSLELEYIKDLYLQTTREITLFTRFTVVKFRLLLTVTMTGCVTRYKEKVGLFLDFFKHEASLQQSL